MAATSTTPAQTPAYRTWAVTADSVDWFVWLAENHPSPERRDVCASIALRMLSGEDVSKSERIKATVKHGIDVATALPPMAPRTRKSVAPVVAPAPVVETAKLTPPVKNAPIVAPVSALIPVGTPVVCEGRPGIVTLATSQGYMVLGAQGQEWWGNNAAIETVGTPVAPVSAPKVPATPPPFDAATFYAPTQEPVVNVAVKANRAIAESASRTTPKSALVTQASKEVLTAPSAAILPGMNASVIVTDDGPVKGMQVSGTVTYVGRNNWGRVKSGGKVYGGKFFGEGLVSNSPAPVEVASKPAVGKRAKQTVKVNEPEVTTRKAIITPVSEGRTVAWLTKSGMPMTGTVIRVAGDNVYISCTGTEIETSLNINKLTVVGA